MILKAVIIEEYNIASWFLSRAIKRFIKESNVKIILSYADSSFHKGTLYQACNFRYYGLTEPRSDFFILQADGSYIKHNRGKVKGLLGEWRKRSRKHRYLYIIDKKINILWKEEKYP